MIKNLAYQREEPDQTAGWYVPGDKMKHFDGFIGKMTLEKGMLMHKEPPILTQCHDIQADQSAERKLPRILGFSLMARRLSSFQGVLCA